MLAILLQCSTAGYNILSVALAAWSLMRWRLVYDLMRTDSFPLLFLLPVLLNGWLLMTLLWSPTPNQGFLLWLKYRGLLFFTLWWVYFWENPQLGSKVLQVLSFSILLLAIASWINRLWLSPNTMMFIDVTRFYPVVMFPIYFGFALLMVAIWFFQQMQQATVKWHSMFYGLSGFLLLATALTLNNNRTSYVIAACFAIYYLGYCVSRKQRPVACVVVVVVFYLLTKTPVFANRWHEAYHNLIDYQHGIVNSSVGLRLYFWQITSKLAWQQPWFGHGLGALPTQTYHPELAIPAMYLRLHDPHQQYLNLWYHGGLVAVGLFLAWLIVLWRSINQNLSVASQWSSRLLIIAFVVGCLDNSWLQGYQEAGLLSLWFLANRVRHNQPSSASSTLQK